ncbi:MAG: hypothetical protein LUE86_13280 [Clostridiales bacterium]|nr:hypothetical protein [Clostridiales bacterium]
MRNYILMHKNDIVATLLLSDDCSTIDKSVTVNDELLPLPARAGIKGLRDWWKYRAAPITQSGLADILQRNHFENQHEFLAKNLALSLNDCYWVKPEGTIYQWEDVNLFQNAFQSYNLDSPEKEVGPFSPASSTIGELKKCWVLHGQERYLIKGNSMEYCQQSLNEVLISGFHKKQGVAPYVDYRMISLMTTFGENGIGCISKSFSSEKLEFIPAIHVVSSEKKPNECSHYEHYIQLCVKHGIQEETIRSFMDYTILSDFLFTNTDRHLNNFGVLRDSDTLQFVGPAPIFDNGNSMFYKNLYLPDLYKVAISSFARTELKQLEYVRDKNLIDFSALPTKSEMENIYSNDPGYEYRREILENGYLQKAGMLYDFCHGKSLNSRSISFDLP